MARLLTIVAAVVAARAVSAAPASTKMHLDDISVGVAADDSWSSITPKVWGGGHEVPNREQTIIGGRHS